MKRSWNPQLWAGFGLVLVGILSYPTFFIRFATTRDFPWANLLLLAIAAYLLAAGLRRAFRRPQECRGKVAGTILVTLSVLLVGFFFEQIFYVSRQIPASLGAPRVGQVAPDFTLSDTNGAAVTLSGLLNSPFRTNDWPPKGDPQDKTAATLLIFYRGYW